MPCRIRKITTVIQCDTARANWQFNLYLHKGLCKQLDFVLKKCYTKKKQYVDCLKDYSGEILLVGINYDKNDKQHTCKIKKIMK